MVAAPRVGQDLPWDGPAEGLLMAKPVRVKTTWFRKDAEHGIEEVASVIASNIWRLGDGVVDNLSKADFDIVTPQRGFRIIAELACFLTHYVDRLVYGRVEDALRTEIVTDVGQRLAGIMEENILVLTGGAKDPDYDFRTGFIDLLNRRMADYSSFVFPVDKASFQTLRFLSLQIRELMEKAHQACPYSRALRGDAVVTLQVD